MSDLWRRWDAELAVRGRIEVAAGLLNDEELVALLANDEDPHRWREKRVLRDEAYRRLRAARPSPPAPSDP